MKPRPHIFKASVTSVLTLFVFGLVYFLVFLIAGGIIYVLSIIPVINKLVGWFFNIRGDTPDMLIILLSTMIACVISLKVQERINKDNSTICLSCIITGSCLVLIHVASLIVNIMNKSGCLANIIQIIGGIALIVEGRKYIVKGNES